MELNRDQRKKISDISAGFAQIVVGAIALGQFFPSAKGLFSWVLLGFGGFLALACCLFSVIILKKEIEP
jgi:hypothetical protein